MPNFTQRVQIYAGTFVLIAGDPVPVAVALVTPPGLPGVAINIHEGTKEAEDATYSLGVLNVTSAFGYLSATDGLLVPKRGILLDLAQTDAAGIHKAWLVRHSLTRTRFDVTAHTRLLLTLLTTRPDGLPA